MKGKNNPMYGVKRKGDENPFFGKTHTDEVKKEIGDKVREYYKNKKNKKSL